MKVVVFYLALIAFSLLSGSTSALQHSGSFSEKLDTLIDLNLNGCLQKVLVQAEDMNNPVLLYLHGGPGSTVICYSHTFSSKLKKQFIFVNWDQRGSGFSYHPGMDTLKISEQQIQEDAIALINYLCTTFHKKKIYLLGHSFGSVIGLRIAAKRPDLLYGYIGVGQVINYDRSVGITYQWLHDTLVKAKDTTGLKRIESAHFPFIDLVTKYGGHHRLSIDLDAIIERSPFYFEGYPELIKRGKAFSQYYVEKNQTRELTSISTLTHMAVPLYFFEGIHDHVIACAPELVEEYCKTVVAPFCKIVWFYQSAHYISVEEPDKFQDELIKIKTEDKIVD